MKGDLGQWKFGWPEQFQKDVLKGTEPFTNSPNEYLPPIELEKEYESFKQQFPEKDSYEDFLSYLLYPRVFEDYYKHVVMYGDTSLLPTPTFFYGLKPNEEISVNIARGKTILVEYLNTNAPDEKGNRLVIFRLNGTIRSVLIRDESVQSATVVNIKVTKPEHVGAPLQGSLSKILVKEGDEVTKNQPLFIIEAMKMETTVVAPQDGVVTTIFLAERTLVHQDDLVVSVKGVE